MTSEPNQVKDRDARDAAGSIGHDAAHKKERTVGGIDLLLAAMAARGHLSEAWKELLKAASSFLAVIEPVLERADREPGKSAHTAVVRLRKQVERLESVSVMGIVETVLTLGQSLNSIFKASGGLDRSETKEAHGKGNGAGPKEEPKAAKVDATRRGARSAKRVKIGGDE